MPKVNKRKSKREKKLERNIKYHFPDEIWENILSFISFDIIEQKLHMPIKTINSILHTIRLSQIFKHIFEKDVYKKYNIEKNKMWSLIHKLKDIEELRADYTFYEFIIYCNGNNKR